MLYLIIIINYFLLKFIRRRVRAYDSQPRFTPIDLTLNTIGYTPAFLYTIYVFIATFEIYFLNFRQNISRNYEAKTISSRTELKIIHDINPIEGTLTKVLSTVSILSLIEDRDRYTFANCITTNKGQWHLYLTRRKLSGV